MRRDSRLVVELVILRLDELFLLDLTERRDGKTTETRDTRHETRDKTDDCGRSYTARLPQFNQSDIIRPESDCTQKNYSISPRGTVGHPLATLTSLLVLHAYGPSTLTELQSSTELPEDILTEMSTSPTAFC